MEHENDPMWKLVKTLLAVAVFLGLLVAAGEWAGNVAKSQTPEPMEYNDLDGKPARFAFACKDQNAFYLALGTLERTMDLNPVKEFFADGSCVFLRGMPAKPEKLAGDPYMDKVLTTKDAEGTPVRVYKIDRGGKTAWVAVWFSEDYGEKL